MLSKDELAVFNTNNIDGCIEILETRWNRDYGTIEIEWNHDLNEATIELMTGGWSENEGLINDIIGTWFWFLWWQESKRGGYYKFKFVDKMTIEK